MKVAVGSLNPTKLEAVKIAFEKVFPNTSWSIKGVSVTSGVSDQPMNDRESIRGAKKRAKRAIKKLNADYGVGLEGGIQKIGKYWFETGWVVIVNKKGDEGIGSAVRMQIPEIVMKHIHNGIELGKVSDIIFHTENSKHGQGYFGLMTNNTITRSRGYSDGVISALSRFIHPQLFDDS